MDKKNKRILIRSAIAGGVLVGLIAAGIAVFLIRKYAPTKERMDVYSYFEVDKNTSKVLVILDGESYTDKAVYSGNMLYIPQTFVADNINVRFYYDEETNGVLYADSSHIYTFLPDETGYKDDEGKSYPTDYAVVKMIDGMCCLSWEYIAEKTDCAYVYADKPARINITLSTDSILCVDAKKKLSVRYRGGIKSPILIDVSKDTKLKYVENYDDWTKVVTPDGITGYVKTEDISQKYEYTRETTFAESYNTNMMDKKVNLGWFQVGGTAGNDYVDSYVASDSGINVISPTWYSVTGQDGDVSCYASSALVKKMHSRGIKVWALVDDFNSDVNFEALFRSRKSRRALIDRLVSDAGVYGFDGINLDFENVKSIYAKDYLQFIRELSVECEKKGLTLSSDSYKPAVYNGCYNLKEQAAFVDYVIVMAYDEHYAGSEPGSVSSLPFVREAVYDTISLVPAGQVVVGIPFYTRIWNTENGTTTSKAVGMQAAIDQLNNDRKTALWNEEFGQYIVSYEVGSIKREIWFEEEKSVEAKMKVIKEANVAGVAEWKLGLEKSGIWSVINEYLK